MLSREELEEIRRETEDSATLDSRAAETIMVLLWHIDALDAQGAPAKLPKGARTLPDGSIRLGAPQRYQRNRKAAQDAYIAVAAKRAEDDD